MKKEKNMTHHQKKIAVNRTRLRDSPDIELSNGDFKVPIISMLKNLMETHA